MISRLRFEVHSAELALGAERADNCISAARSLRVKGAGVGAPTYTAAGVVLAGGNRLEYPAVSLTLPFSVVVKFSTATAQESAIIGNANLMTGLLATGFCIWVDADGVKAAYCDGANTESTDIDLDYADGLEHTITYVVDSGVHTLYVDDLSVTASTTVAGPINSSLPVTAGGLLT